MTVRPLTSQPDIWEHRGFMLAEDEALKTYLSNIQVPGQNREDPWINVGVWFRWPTGERQIKYPFITIDSISAEPAYDLFTSDHIEPVEGLYWPDQSPTLPAPSGGWGLMSYGIRNFLPFRVVYQINVYSRHNLHDRYLRSIFATDVFPQRPFWVACDTDQTWRRVEQVGYTATDQAETSESGTKRIFRKVYTVCMLAEVPQTRLIDSEFWRVFRVFLSVKDRETMENEYFWLAHEGQEVPTPTP